MGSFDPEGLRRLEALLKSIDLEDSPTIDRRLVSLLWYIPLFMIWQKERFNKRGEVPPSLGRGIGEVEAALETILGVP